MNAPVLEQEAPPQSNWDPGLLASLLRRNRLTLLTCRAGAARDAMLRRGLMPLLQATRPPDGWAERALRFDAWGTLPLRALRQQVDHVMPPQHEELATLAEQLAAAGWQEDVRLLLVLDAFEQHLRLPAQRADIAHFDIELARCLVDPAVPVHVLIVVDDIMRPSLHRYERWIPGFGREGLRLPDAPADAEALWSDTQIDPLSEDDSDDAMQEIELLEAHGHEWTLDLSLDEPAATAEPPDSAPAAAPAGKAPSMPTAAVADETEPAVSRSPAPSAAPVPPFVPPLVPPLVPPRVPPYVPPRMQPTPQPPPLWPPDDAAATAPAERSRPDPLPSWAVEPDARTMHPPAQWWRRGWLRPLGDAAVLLIGIWLVVTWLLGDGRTPTQESAAPPSAPAATPAAPPPATAQQQPTPPVPAAPAPPIPAARPMTIALPLDGGAALIDELVRQVAAPAGLALSVVPPQAEATLAVWRHDALLAARGSQAPPLRVLAPLFSEQIQVVVRNDAAWDYAREIKGLRLNVGPSGSARARTARTLYASMFGAPPVAEQLNELDETAALRHLLRRGGPIDAIVVVSELPLLNRLPPDSRAQLRELPFDADDRRTAGALQVYPLKRRSAGERPRPAVGSFLVTGAAPHPHEDALRALVVALCRAQPALQARGSPLLRGFAQGEQPAVGWPYLLPRRADGGCPGAPPASEAVRSGTQR